MIQTPQKQKTKPALPQPRAAAKPAVPAATDISPELTAFFDAALAILNRVAQSKPTQ